MQKASCTGKPSARAGPVSPGVFESLEEGLCRLLPEPVRRIGRGRLLFYSTDHLPLEAADYDSSVARAIRQPSASAIMPA